MPPPVPVCARLCRSASTCLHQPQPAQPRRLSSRGPQWHVTVVFPLFFSPKFPQTCVPALPAQRAQRAQRCQWQMYQNAHGALAKAAGHHAQKAESGESCYSTRVVLMHAFWTLLRCPRRIRACSGAILASSKNPCERHHLHTECTSPKPQPSSSALAHTSPKSTDIVTSPLHLL